MKLLPTLLLMVAGCAGAVRTPESREPGPRAAEERPGPDPDMEVVLNAAEEYVTKMVDAMGQACSSLPDPESRDACSQAVVGRWLPVMRSIEKVRGRSGAKGRPKGTGSGPFAGGPPANGPRALRAGIEPARRP